MWRQPKTVWSVAFACAVAFMGIGLVDPILKPIADELGAGPSEVSLLFTSYLSAHLPFWAGAGVVLLSVAVLSTGRAFVRAIDEQPGHGAERVDSVIEAEAVTVGDA
jgi:hypothetical protein